MPNKYLLREDAPFTPAIWGMLDTVAMEAAKSQLAGRRILDVEGPYGLGLKAVPMEDREVEPGISVSGSLPVLLVERRFTISKRDLAAFERDPVSPVLRTVAEAAIAAARLEDSVIFNGAAGVKGLLTAAGSSVQTLASWAEPGAAADDIIRAITLLDQAGFHGPYALALPPERYNLLLRRYPNGYISELEHIQTMATGGVVKAAALTSGGVLLATGIQFASIVIGQDMSVGFIGPVDGSFELTISETLVPLVRVPSAICVLEDAAAID